MVDLIATVEASRRLGRMSQQEVAQALGITQGHYSKVSKGLVPLSDRVSGRMESWLAGRGQAAAEAGSATATQIAAEIRAKCMELMHLAEDLVGWTSLEKAPGTEGAKLPTRQRRGSRG